jgi:hypothetical protein
MLVFLLLFLILQLVVGIYFAKHNPAPVCWFLTSQQSHFCVNCIKLKEKKKRKEKKAKFGKVTSVP